MKKNVVLYSSNKKSHGALAQLGAHDTGSVGVTGSSPVCSITRKGRFKASFCRYVAPRFGERAGYQHGTGFLFTKAFHI